MKNHRMTLAFLCAIVVGLCINATALAQKPVIQTMSEATWGDAPPMLPPGAKIAVLSGNPMGNSLYTLRLKFPANYKIPAHSHPTDENVTVLSGSLYIGMGDKLNEKGAKQLGVGGYGMMPANMNHFAFTKKATIVLLHGQGPVEFKYVNPNDDPRNKPAVTKLQK
jgi:quercetin dioxygenase-like cupin family protein